MGIALMGNFDEQEPTEEMLNALIRLTTVLVLEFDIDPGKTQAYFTPTDVAPYLEVHEHPSIVGHKDTKNTACPGKHIYELLPEIKARVALNVNYFHDLGEDAGSVEVRSLATPYLLDGSE
ncbi:MAG: N-acetylmuramoyl-L-alanine amidase [Candidatus Peribacteria bacterium]|nr:MAG: N-acetylmuramoyl-L-alanine amidase [Candidatus Peribacteria bacterium]